MSALVEFVGSKLSAASTSNEHSHAARYGTRSGSAAPTLAASPVPPGAVAVTSVSHRLPAGFIAGSCFDAVDAVTCVPFSRWDISAASEAAGEMQAGFGSFVPHVAAFDAAAFGMSEAEAGLQDPQQRLLMEVSCETLGAAAEFAADAASYRSSCGVFVGVSSRDYFTLGKLYSQVRLLATRLLA